MGGKYLLVLPPDRLSGGKGLGYIQQPLVPAAPEAEGDVVLGLHKAAVHQHIQQAQQLVGDFAPGVAGNRPGQLLPGVAGVPYSPQSLPLLLLSVCVAPLPINFLIPRLRYHV